MRLLVFSDVHGNLSALEAVLFEATKLGVDRFMFLGDAVSYGPYPKECLDVLCGKNGLISIAGNHDSLMLQPEFSIDSLGMGHRTGIMENVGWTYEHLTDSDRGRIREFKPRYVEEIEGWSLCFVHASGETNQSSIWPTASDEKYIATFGSYDLACYGHIHQQFVRRAGKHTYLNPGSVGLPTDGDKRAAYAIIDTMSDALTITLHRADYDNTITLQALKALDLPPCPMVEKALRTGIDLEYEEKFRSLRLPPGKTQQESCTSFRLEAKDRKR